MGKGGYWIPAEIEDIEITYSYEKHSPKQLKGTPWLYCRYCGLVYLKNKVTRWCIKMGCNHEYHKDYNHILGR
jgi:hypothetical protein